MDILMTLPLTKQSYLVDLIEEYNLYALHEANHEDTEHLRFLLHYAGVPVYEDDPMDFSKARASYEATRKLICGFESTLGIKILALILKAEKSKNKLSKEDLKPFDEPLLNSALNRLKEHKWISSVI